MQKHSHVKRDFGLRSIKAIINIAQILKRQVSGLQNSDLPDFINEKLMGKIPWRDQRLIGDVMMELCSDQASSKP